MSAPFNLLAPAGVAAAVEIGNDKALRFISDWPDADPADTEAWLVVGVAHGRVPTSWRVLDFDNKRALATVGRRIGAVVQSLLAQLSRDGTRAFYFPSKSGWASPVVRAGHVFVWLPHLAPVDQERWLLAELERVLGRDPSALSAVERSDAGLDDHLRIFFPPDDDVGAALSVAPIAELQKFRRAWMRFSGLD